MGRSSKADLAAKGSEEGGATASGAAKNDKESAGAAPKMKGRKRRRGARVRQKINICWFRRNLRVYHDNPALIKAMSGDLPLLCMYCLTPYMLPSRHRKRKRQFYQGTGVVAEHERNACGVQYFNFLLQSLREVQTSLQRMGQDLYVFEGHRESDIFRFLFDEFEVQNVFMEQDLEPYGLNRDDVVTNMAASGGTNVISYASNMLWDVRDVLLVERVGVEEDEDDLKKATLPSGEAIYTTTGGASSSSSGGALGGFNFDADDGLVTGDVPAPTATGKDAPISIPPMILPESFDKWRDLVAEAGDPQRPAKWFSGSKDPTKWAEWDTCLGKKPTRVEDYHRAEFAFAQKTVPAVPADLDTEPFASMASNKVPTLKDLTLSKQDEVPASDVKYRGGEQEALRRLDFLVKKGKTKILDYDSETMNPMMIDREFNFWPTTLGVSAYIAHGCLSVRTLYSEVKKLFDASDKDFEKSEVIKNLMWRDYFYTCGFTVENFGQLHKNQVVRQIPWENDADYMRRFEMGRTGYPFLDAIMNQLRAEGWVPGVLRQIACCFFTRGNLYQSWEKGRDIFAKYAVDHDWALQTGGWMMSSCAAFDDKFGNVYDPAEIGKTFDKMGRYVTFFVPKLRNMPDKYLYQPWNASEAVQEQAGCIIGSDYPSIICKHSETAKINYDLTRRVFQQGKKPNWSIRREAAEYLFFQSNKEEVILELMGGGKAAASSSGAPDAKKQKVAGAAKTTASSSSTGGPGSPKKPVPKEFLENDLLFGDERNPKKVFGRMPPKRSPRRAAGGSGDAAQSAADDIKKKFGGSEIDLQKALAKDAAASTNKMKKKRANDEEDDLLADDDANTGPKTKKGKTTGATKMGKKQVATSGKEAAKNSKSSSTKAAAVASSSTSSTDKASTGVTIPSSSKGPLAAIGGPAFVEVDDGVTDEADAEAAALIVKATELDNHLLPNKSEQDGGTSTGATSSKAKASAIFPSSSANLIMSGGANRIDTSKGPRPGGTSSSTKAGGTGATTRSGSQPRNASSGDSPKPKATSVMKKAVDAKGASSSSSSSGAAASKKNTKMNAAKAQASPKGKAASPKDAPAPGSKKPAMKKQ
ncbi:unnamed protein product [Amoebophrya sp. A25]|nr:unnamed protein product [Amoebophrya sp. A25]|eukprot:GSA25T00019818001.1